MNKGQVFAIAVLGVLGVAPGIRAQQITEESSAAASTALNSTAATSARRDFVGFMYAPALSSASSLAKTSFAPLATPAAPHAAPDPGLLYGSRDDYRLQLALSYTYVRFRGAPLLADLHGLDTTVVWYTNEWLGVEGDVSAAFGIRSGAGRFKYLMYGGGIRMAWRQRHWEPWLHVIAGGAYVQPQLAGLTKAGFAYKGGGGIDWRVLPRFSWRLQGDWVRSQLYSQTQNNIQIVSGVVLHF